jgi:hypothetical protein
LVGAAILVVAVCLAIPATRKVTAPRVTERPG